MWAAELHHSWLGTWCCSRGFCFGDEREREQLQYVYRGVEIGQLAIAICKERIHSTILFESPSLKQTQTMSTPAASTGGAGSATGGTATAAAQTGGGDMDYLDKVSRLNQWIERERWAMSDER